MTGNILDRAAEAVEPVAWRYRIASDRKWTVQKNKPDWWRDDLLAKGYKLEPLMPASHKLVPEMAEEIAALRSALDLIASGQVDAVALARAEKRRWGR